MLITSSVASTMPGSFQAVYNASKSFLQSFAQALQTELKDTRETITSLMPGPTETHFFRRADMLDTKVGQQDKDDPEHVAAQGFEALMASRGKLIAGSLSTKARVPTSSRRRVVRGTGSSPPDGLPAYHRTGPVLLVRRSSIRPGACERLTAEVFG